jgi:hypothetical protein
MAVQGPPHSAAIWLAVGNSTLTADAVDQLNGATISARLPGYNHPSETLPSCSTFYLEHMLATHAVSLPRSSRSRHQAKSGRTRFTG